MNKAQVSLGRDRLNIGQQIENVFKNMPEEEKNPQLDELQERGLTTVLREYKNKRDDLIAAKENGFNPQVNYKELMSKLEHDKQILDAGLAFHQKIEAKRFEQIGDLPEKLRKIRTILSTFSGRVNLMITERENNTQQDQLLSGAMAFINGCRGTAGSHLGDLLMTSPYDEALATKAEEARAFLANLPDELSNQVANEALYEQLNTAGKTQLDKFVEWLTEALEDICKALDIECKFEPKLGRAYKGEFDSLVSKIQDTELDVDVARTAHQI